MLPTIKTNHAPRNLYNGCEFGNSERVKLRKEFDHLTEEEFNDSYFFKYKDIWYNLEDFIKTTSNQYSSFDYREWDAYYPDTVWSGILIKYNGCDQTVVVGRYYS